MRCLSGQARTERQNLSAALATLASAWEPGAIAASCDRLGGAAQGVLRQLTRTALIPPSLLNESWASSEQFERQAGSAPASAEVERVRAERGP